MVNTPLPETLRPKKLSEFVGQKKLTGPHGIIRNLLRNSVTSQFFPSLILWGPPGSGKTTLARIIANTLKREFFEFSAVNAKVKEIENAIGTLLGFPLPAGRHGLKGRVPIIFLDEIHRFNKAQQDKLLPHVEKGNIVLIGATTENPSFEVIGPLLSRTRVLVLEQLNNTELKKIEKNALKYLKKNIDKDAEKFLIEASNGDARVLLNVLEIAANINPEVSTGIHPQGVLKLADIETALQQRQYTFDKRGEDFYNIISAFIKSMRASDVDAALYYLARMVAAGQDPLYIARRMVIFASEDVGMAQPTALVVANEVFRACEIIGYPECQENLAHGVVYLALAKKDRSSYDAYFEALGDVKKYGNLPVPMKVRNPVTKLMKDVGYGKDYDMYDTNSHLPDKLSGKQYYKRLKDQQQ